MDTATLEKPAATSPFSPKRDGTVVAVIPKYRDPLVSNFRCPSFSVILKTAEEGGVSRLDVFQVSRYVTDGEKGNQVLLSELRRLREGEFISRDHVFGELDENIETNTERHHIFNARRTRTFNFEPIGSTDFLPGNTVIDVSIEGYLPVIKALGGPLYDYYRNLAWYWDDICRVYEKYSELEMTFEMSDLVRTALAMRMSGLPGPVTEDKASNELARQSGLLGPDAPEYNEIRITTTYKNA